LAGERHQPIFNSPPEMPLTRIPDTRVVAVLDRACLSIMHAYRSHEARFTVLFPVPLVGLVTLEFNRIATHGDRIKRSLSSRSQ
jgi:hypothetical protein